MKIIDTQTEIAPVRFPIDSGIAPLKLCLLKSKINPDLIWNSRGLGMDITTEIVVQNKLPNPLKLK
jgi:hypothetical protein